MFVIDDIAKLATTVVNKIFPDKTQTEKDKLALEMQLATQEFNLAQGQVDINKVEAASSSVFVAGWRPFIGWICGIAFAANYIFVPIIIEPILRYFGQPDISPLAVGELTPILIAMLGIGTLRTYEKVKGVASSGTK